MTRKEIEEVYLKPSLIVLFAVSLLVLIACCLNSILWIIAGLLVIVACMASIWLIVLLLMWLTIIIFQ